MMKRTVHLMTLLALTYTCGGCGFLIDKDNIVVAVYEGKDITRGDLSRLLREMSDEERPIIRNRSDLEATLLKMIDDRIKESSALNLKTEGKISVPRERAEALYFARKPDLQTVRTVTDPAALGLTSDQLARMKEEVEIGIDKVELELLGTTAVGYLSKEAFESGKLVITDEELQAEHRLTGGHLLSAELLEFDAVRFPESIPAADEAASRIRSRITNGEKFRDIYNGFMNDPNKRALCFPSGLSNDPGNSFQSFWALASGTQVGEVLGPVYFPPSMNATTGQTIPGAWLVLEITKRVPPMPMSVEEAKSTLVPMIGYRKMLEILRKEHGAEIFTDKLPDPSLFSPENFDPLA